MDITTSTNSYAVRTNRNIGWITEEEQQILRHSVIGIAGCGGMGGLLAATLVRLGIGEIRIADSETFDVSNINRQFAANQKTIGKSKVQETARMLKEIASDTKILVFPNGITPSCVEEFSSGCSLICDEIEFWAVGSRIILHQAARRENIPLFTCSSVGFGSRLFYFDHHNGKSIEEMFMLQCDEALAFEERLYAQTATVEEIQNVLTAVLDALIPEVPRYTSPTTLYDDRATCIQRLRNEQRASIIATNPPLATGFLANWVLLTLLKISGVERNISHLPAPPGYLYLDSAELRMDSVVRSEVQHGY